LKSLHPVGALPHSAAPLKDAQTIALAQARTTNSQCPFIVDPPPGSSYAAENRSLGFMIKIAKKRAVCRFV
jgi:hypothetical protein